MIIEQFETGGDRNFAYLCADEKWKVAMVVDPSYDPDALAMYAEDWGLKIHYVFNTHRHDDHTNGNERMRKLTGRHAMGYGDVEEITQVKLLDGIRLPLGDHEVEIIHTPGHTEDCICLRVDDALFTGDTLFVGKVGGTTTEKQARSEFESLHRKLMGLPDNVRVFPGHDFGVKPVSTIGEEKKTNPFLLRIDFKSFYELKQNWLEYKKQHGIA
ncbi:MAG: MBL fold metallo-hydrolase [bacterium]